jgi:DNA repair exonuclease SbcCD nuclease subunit
MQFIHIADTHLGRAAFNKLAEDGSNLRETLIYENFLAAIERIIQEKPDALVHAGDLFDAVKPKTKAYTTVLEALEWLQEAGIPLVLIAGNHSMQKTLHTVSPLEVIARSNMIHAAYSFRYEKVEIGDTIFHLIPNMLHPEDYHTAHKEIAISKDHNNVLVTHGLATTIRDKRLSTVAEFELDSEILTDQFDYIALGHYHGQVRIAPNAWYSGSIEHLTYGEIADTKGGLLVNPARTYGVEHFSLVRSPMRDLGVIDCSPGGHNGIGYENIVEAIEEEIGLLDGMGDQMFQITLDYGDNPVRLPPAEALAKIRESVLDLKIRVKSQETAAQAIPQQQDLHAIDYVREFGKFLQHRPRSGIRISRPRLPGTACTQSTSYPCRSSGITGRSGCRRWVE